MIRKFLFAALLVAVYVLSALVFRTTLQDERSGASLNDSRGAHRHGSSVTASSKSSTERDERVDVVVANSPSAQRIAGTLSRHDHSPAREVPYRVEGREGDSEPGKTDAMGRWSCEPRNEDFIVVFQVDEHIELRKTITSTATRDIVLPRLANISVTLVTPQTWAYIIDVRPLKPCVKLSSSLAIHTAPLTRRVDGGSAIIQGVAGMKYSIAAHGLGVELAPGYHTTAAPAAVVFKSSTVRPWLRLQVVGTDRQREIGISGRVSIRDGSSCLEEYIASGACDISSKARLQWGQTYHIVATLSSGERFVRKVTAERMPLGTPQLVECVVGQGERPVTISPIRGKVRRLLFSQRNMGHLKLRGISESIATGDMGPTFTLAKTSALVHGLPGDWEAIWIVLTDGRVLRTSRSDDSAPQSVTEIPARGPYTIDVHKVARRFAAPDKLSVSLQFRWPEPVKGREWWVTVDTVHVKGEALVWTKWTPRGWSARLSIRGRGEYGTINQNVRLD